MSATTSDSAPPISDGRVAECLKSARFWCAQLPLYANRMQSWADFWAISAGLMAAITGLAIWPVLGESPTNTEKVLVSVGALLSAICALVPRVLNHGERAGAARELTTRYGSVIGLLEDLHRVSAAQYPEAALKAVTAFEATKEKKDALRRVGSRDQMMAGRRKEAARAHSGALQEHVKLAEMQDALQQEIEMHRVLQRELAELAERQAALEQQLLTMPHIAE